MMRRDWRFLYGALCFCTIALSTQGAFAQALFTQTTEKPAARPNANNINTNTNSNTPDVLGAFLDKLSDTSQVTLDVASTVTSTVLDAAQSVVVNALGLIGVAYKYGGNSTEQGLDCSGFVKLVFEQTLGLVLPRQSSEMSKLGDEVNSDDLQPGDLVFYNTLKRDNSHVGIYIGEGQFVHAPSKGGKVRTENMSKPYWKNRYNGAKRVGQLLSALKP